MLLIHHVGYLWQVPRSTAILLFSHFYPTVQLTVGQEVREYFLEKQAPASFKEVWYQMAIWLTLQERLNGFKSQIKVQSDWEMVGPYWTSVWKGRYCGKSDRDRTKPGGRKCWGRNGAYGGSDKGSSTHSGAPSVNLTALFLALPLFFFCDFSPFAVTVVDNASTQTFYVSKKKSPASQLYLKTQ